jgi:hypothetical protein
MTPDVLRFPAAGPVPTPSDLNERILAVLSAVHTLTAEDVCAAIACSHDTAVTTLDAMVSDGRLTSHPAWRKGAQRYSLSVAYTQGGVTLVPSERGTT